MKMNAYGYTKDIEVRAAKTPCLMVMSVRESNPDEMAEPVMLHIVAGEVWVTDYATFMDAGFIDEHTIVPIATNEGWDDAKAVRDAWVVYDGIAEFGEPGSVLESIEWREMFAALWKFKTGNELVFKKEGC